LSDPASARRYQMSGTWVMRTGEVFLPLQLDADGAMDGRDSLVVSMGDLTGAVGFPNRAMLGGGRVTATGGAPAMLRVPAHGFVGAGMAVLRPEGGRWVQIATNGGFAARSAAASLAAGAGPGSFTWCPQDPACAAGGGMRSTDPPQGAGTRNGRVIYRAGANQFGGTMQLGLSRGGATSALFSSVPYRVGHNLFGFGSALQPPAGGGLGSADAPAKRTIFLKRAFATQPTMVPMFPNCLIRYPGPKVTTMRGVSTTGSGPVYYLPTIATGPMGTKAGQFTTRYGFGQTT